MRNFNKGWWLSGLIIAGVAVSGCEAPDEADPQDDWWNALQEHCGEAFSGELTEYEDEDDGWLGVDVIMHVRECSETEIRIPLHVGDDHSRTWVLTRSQDGIELKHDHRYPDGSEETLHWYGGSTTDPGTATRQEFPADEFSRELFETEGNPDSAENTWYMEIHPGEEFVYGLTRFNREFEARFDLTSPVETPRAPWGVEPEEEDGGDDNGDD